MYLSSPTLTIELFLSQFHSPNKRTHIRLPHNINHKLDCKDVCMSLTNTAHQEPSSYPTHTSALTIQPTRLKGILSGIVYLLVNPYSSILETTNCKFTVLFRNHKLFRCFSSLSMKSFRKMRFSHQIFTRFRDFSRNQHIA